MAKFAGFWKRVKNFGINALNSTVNAMSKVNNLYKQYKPFINTGIDALMSAIPGGSLAAPIVNLGLNKVSNMIDLAKYGIDHPNTFLPSNVPKHTDGPIHVGKISQQDKIKSRLDELRRINTSSSN